MPKIIRLNLIDLCNKTIVDKIRDDQTSTYVIKAEYDNDYKFIYLTRAVILSIVDCNNKLTDDN